MGDLGNGLQHTVTVNGQSNASQVLYAGRGENLFALLRRSGVSLAAPCGGGARCGKCLVRVETDLSDINPPTGDEMKLLSKGLMQKGYRLACFLEVKSDMAVTVSTVAAAEAKILTSGIKPDLPFGPYVKKLAIRLTAQTLEDQTPEDRHLINMLKAQYPDENIYGDGQMDIELLRALPGAMRAPEGGADAVTCVCAGGRITGVEPGDTTGRIFGAAFDIGTTTIAGYLFDMTNGAPSAVVSSLNPQAAYGADVISRINYTISAADGLVEMRASALGELNRLLGALTAQAGAARGDVYSVYITGNTTMLHFFMGLPSGRIAAAPFIPVTTGAHILAQPDSGLDINKSGIAVCLPGVSAYVGADTLSAALACDMDTPGGNNLLIDIGTNGEILIGGGETFYACSTAAGPAFEGANIRCGAGGVDGAVDSAQINPDGSVEYTTIGGADVIGICGSGVVDAVSQMLKCGLIDETGRLIDADEAEDEGLHPELCGRLVTLGDGARAFCLIPPKESQKDSEASENNTAQKNSTALKDSAELKDSARVYGEKGGENIALTEGIHITQRDIREIQNAKAAIAAGIKTLLLKSGLGAGDISGVYLAGGFGNYIRVSSALNIGLIPNEFDGRILPSGNAAGAGAVCALLSGQAAGRMDALSSKIRYIELSASPEFTQEYIDCMMFE